MGFDGVSRVGAAAFMQARAANDHIFAAQAPPPQAPHHQPQRR
jgi:hypothetical protein